MLAIEGTVLLRIGQVWYSDEPILEEKAIFIHPDYRSAKVQAKIRDAQLELVPYMVVVGPREAEAGAVALRDRIDGDLGSMPLDAAIVRLRDEVALKTIRQVAEKKFAAVDEGGGEANEY